jgi:hypothetical protein
MTTQTPSATAPPRIAPIAQGVLELDCERADELFAASTTLADLRRIVPDIEADEDKSQDVTVDFGHVLPNGEVVPVR